MSNVQKGKGRGRWFWGFFAAWAVALTILSSVPGSRFGPSPFFEADKVVHFILFSVGAGLLTIAILLTTGQISFRMAILIWIIMIAVGVGDEIHQLYTPGRSGGDLGDITADAAGAASGIFLIFFYGKRFSTRLRAAGADRAP